MRSNGWIIEQTGSIEIPVVVLSAVSLLVGFRGMTVASLSISDPVRRWSTPWPRLSTAGSAPRWTSRAVRNQPSANGIQQQVAGLAERDRLRDLFGRHVGADVARRALSETDELTGEVREAAVLFVDLVGSTRLAQARSPEEVAEVLNRFFRDVVAVVDERGGLSTSSRATRCWRSSVCRW